MCSETNNAQLYPSILRLVLCCIIKYSFSIPWFVLILHCWWDSMRTSLGFEQSWALNCCPSFPFASSTTSSRHPAAPIAARLLLPLLSLSLLLLAPWCTNLLQLPRLSAVLGSVFYYHCHWCPFFLLLTLCQLCLFNRFIRFFNCITFSFRQ